MNSNLSLNPNHHLLINNNLNSSNPNPNPAASNAADANQPPAIKDWTDIKMDPPHWYESRNIMQTIGFIFKALDTVAITATIVFAAKKFIAKQTVPNKTITALATASLTLFGLIYTFFSKKAFWKDPMYLNERGRQIWDGLRSQKEIPSYLDMITAFPNEMHGLLKNEDELFSGLLCKDAYNLKFPNFIEKHGTNNALALLDQASKKHLAEPIFLDIATFSLDYMNIMNRHGSAALDLLVAIDKDRLLALLIVNSGIQGINDRMRIPYRKLGFTEEQCMSAILTHEVNLLSNGQLTFDAFRNRNAFYHRRVKDFPDMHLIKNAFIKVLETESSKYFLVALKQAYSDELRVFNLSDAELVKILWPLQKSQVCSYNDFKTKYGSDYLTTLLSQEPEAKLLFKQQFLTEAESQGISKMIDHPTIIHSLDLTYEDIAKELGDKLETQFKANPAWEPFHSKHQPLITHLIKNKPDFKQLLIDAFVSYPSLDQNAKNFCEILGLTQTDIAKAVCDYATKVSPHTFSYRIGGISILLNETIISVENKAIIQKHFFDEFVQDLQGIDSFLSEKMFLKYLGFTITDVVKERWKGKDVATIIKMSDMDLKQFIAHLNNPILGLAAKVDNEIAGKDLKSILTNYSEVLSNDSPNLQKAIAQYYLENLSLAYGIANTNATINFLKELEIAPKAEVAAKFNVAKVAYQEAYKTWEDNQKQADELLNQTIHKADVTLLQAKQPHLEKLQLIKLKLEKIDNSIAKLNEDLEVQQKDCKDNKDKITGTIQSLTQEIAEAQTMRAQQSEIVEKATAEYEDVCRPFSEKYQRAIEAAQRTAEWKKKDNAGMLEKVEKAIKDNLEAFLKTQIV